MFAAAFSLQDNEPDMLRLLLQHPNIDINAVGHKWLPICMFYGWNIDSFLEHPFIDVSKPERSGHTLLMLCVRSFPGYFQPLIALGADVNSQTKHGLTTLHIVLEKSVPLHALRLLA